ncbi:MAG TPA: M20 family metallopeptidase [Acidimicrobiales bacterium]|jgi:amidohydrolase|nr:M20 family metallopeptidase [Acidimicrobiales bacterium]
MNGRDGSASDERPRRAKSEAEGAVDALADALVELSHRLHANPEISWEEENSSRWCADLLSEGGFDVTMGVGDLPTAFEAKTGSGDLVIAICAEYDALPGVGHACGHNVIAASAVGAGLALLPLADDLGITVKVMGTPAEEGGGGKILMLDRGVFDGVHAAMMVHPAPSEMDNMPCLAVAHVEVHYTGKEAHASAFPELGINAADAQTIAQTSVGLLRQHISPNARIHGIVTHGGDAPNVVPAHTTSKWYIREETLAQLAQLQPRVERCFEAGAAATGCTYEIEEKSPPYSEMRDDLELRALYRKNAEDLGRTFMDLGGPLAQKLAGSTDMANISLAIPTIHPMLGLGCFPVSNHQPEFAAFCATPTADEAMRDGAVAMAQTVIDAATTDSVRRRLLAGQRQSA